jgi:hypothetical protein
VVEVIFEKVKGHRANLVPFNKLTHPEQLNDMMDVWAKVRVDQIFAEQMPPPPMSIQFEGWRYSINDAHCPPTPMNPLCPNQNFSILPGLLPNVRKWL